MSLSFVASAIQTGTEAAGYEETPIESKEVEAVNKRNQHKPLFEQLRQNKEAEEAKLEEQKLELMRATGTLNEEDVAHLDALEKQRKQREAHAKKLAEDELAAFRAARAEKQQVFLEEETGDVDDTYKDRDLKESVDQPSARTSRKPAPLVPTVLKKRRRLNTYQSSTPPSGETKKTKSANTDTVSKVKEDPITSKGSSAAGLGDLLGGYGSSGDESD